MSSRPNAAPILLVEDHPADAELALRALRDSNLTTRVDWVKDGEEALDYLFQRGEYEDLEGLPRLVMLDLGLPKTSGIDVLRNMRSSEVTRRVPVVVLTSSNEERDVTESYDLGVNGFVPKPVSFEAFSATVAQLGLYRLLLVRAIRTDP